MAQHAIAGIIDHIRVNEARLPAYHSLNLRLDRRFFFRQTSMVVYLSLWNVCNRKNIAVYYWNTVENQADAYYQWSLIPIGGFGGNFSRKES